MQDQGALCSEKELYARTLSALNRGAIPREPDIEGTRLGLYYEPRLHQNL